MNSKEAIKRLRQETAPATYMPDFDKEKCLQIIEQDLDRLKKLEIESKNNQGLVKENTNLINRNLKLQDENKKLKEKFKMLEENEEVVLTTLEIAVQENIKLKKAFDILKDSFEIVAVKEDWDSEYIIETNSYFVCINKEEYEILKEVLGND